MPERSPRCRAAPAPPAVAGPRPLHEVATKAQITTAAQQVWKVIQPMPDHLREFVRLLSIEVTR